MSRLLTRRSFVVGLTGTVGAAVVASACGSDAESESGVGAGADAGTEGTDAGMDRSDGEAQAVAAFTDGTFFSDGTGFTG